MTEKDRAKTTHQLANLLERGDEVLYGCIGIAFLFIGGFVFIYSLALFWQGVRTGDALGTTLNLISDLLLVVIILEILRTIIHYLRMHTILLTPFLYIGIIAITRRIILAGAQLSFSDIVGTPKFYAFLWELAVNGLLIIAFGLALFLYGRVRPENP